MDLLPNSSKPSERKTNVNTSYITAKCATADNSCKLLLGGCSFTATPKPEKDITAIQQNATLIKNKI